MIRSRTRSGRLVPVLRSVVALPGTSLADKGRYRAATYAGGPRCVLSHRSALALHGLVADYRREVQITRTSGSHGGNGTSLRNSGNFDFWVRCHQTRSLPSEHITALEGIPAMTVERALLAFAGEASESEISKALSQGERERCLCWKTLGTMIENTNGIRGLRRLKRQIAEWTPAFTDAASDPEEDFLALIVEAGLPLPVVNQRIGDVVPDFLWKELGLVVELDPYGTHNGYERFHRDRRKGVLLERQGLRVIRFTWVDLYHHPERTMRELREIIAIQAAAKA